MPKDFDLTQERYLGIEKLDTSPFQIIKTSSRVGSKASMYVGDRGNYGWPDTKSMPKENIGGPFFLKGSKVTDTTSANLEYWRGGSANQGYTGCFRANLSQPNVPTNTGNDSSVDGSQWAAAAYKRMKPTKPLYEFANSLYELRELGQLLSMFREGLLHRGLRSIGDYHLALQFGWGPMLRDIVAACSAQQSLQDRIAWLIRHNGKPVRRRVSMLDYESDKVVTTGTLYGALQPTLVTQYYVSQPTWRRTTWSTDKVWASARFRYHLPGDPGTVQFNRVMKAALLGFKPSPSVLWNALPWTWLSDWFLNTGAILSNMDAGVATSCAADYFYVMREKHSYTSYEANGRFRLRDGTVVPVSASSLSDVYTKSRIMGDPFGWQTNPNTLTGSQLAILGALGLSRL